MLLDKEADLRTIPHLPLEHSIVSNLVLLANGWIA